jgi:hypothetical protein
MKRKIGTTIKADKRKLTADVGDSIIAELAKGDIKETFRHLKGWYRKAAEMQARPCRQMMERQTTQSGLRTARRSQQMGLLLPSATINQLMASYGLRFPC